MRELQKEISDEKERDELRKHGQSSGILPSNKNPKLEWMYKNTAELLNRDEYLLGKAVDKNFEELDKQEKSSSTIGIKHQKNHVEHDVVPFSIREYKGVNTSDQVDLQRKLMEDPLMAIRQKEMDSRRKILENPVKLKELHRILKTQTSAESSKKSKKSKKKHKKDSKKKKRRDSSSSLSSSDEDLDKMLVKQIKEMKKNSTAKDLEKLLDSKYEKISKELDKAVKHKKKKSKKERRARSESSSRTPEKRQRTPVRKQERSISPRAHRHVDLPIRRQESSTSRQRDSRERRRSRSPQRNNPFKIQESRYISKSPSTRRDNPFGGRQEKKPFNYNQSNRSISPRGRSPFNERHERKPFNYNHGNKSFSPGGRPPYQQDKPFFQKPNRDLSRSGSPPRQPPPQRRAFDERRDAKRIPSPRRNTISPRKRRSFTPERRNPFNTSPKRSNRPGKLSDDEKQRRLQEMTQNAAWRDEDRTRNVQKYREDYKREEEAHKNRDFDNNFVNKQVHKAFDSQNSVESRLKSHKNNIQRSSNSMNYNFARK